MLCSCRKSWYFNACTIPNDLNCIKIKTVPGTPASYRFSMSGSSPALCFAVKIMPQHCNIKTGYTSGRMWRCIAGRSCSINNLVHLVFLKKPKKPKTNKKPETKPQKNPTSNHPYAKCGRITEFCQFGKQHLF